MTAIIDVSVENGVQVISIDTGRGVLRMKFEKATALALAMGKAALDQGEYGRFEIGLSGAGRC